ncbi:MAG: hypothetical protein LBP59_00255 [Planctomycetaceae bacterium]|nr:hypothetical protein [Planctomycetaceae bacterium]
MKFNIWIVLEIQRFKSVKACRPKVSQASVNRKLKCEQFKILGVCNLSKFKIGEPNGIEEDRQSAGR